MKQITLVILVFISVSLFAVDNFTGNALDFDGENDYVSIADDSSLDLNTFTVSLWIKPNGTGGQFIINKGENAVVGVGYRIYLDSTTLWADTFVPARVYSSGTVTIGVWQHIAFTYNGTNQKLYVDGNLVDYDNQSGSLETNDDPLMLGCRLLNSNESDFFEGELDEVRIWNVARTQTEINDNMNLTLSGSETGLVSYWQLNESTGTTASDVVGINDGTLFNMTDDDWVTSTAPVGFPTLTTTIAGSITHNSAESGGNVIWEGESAVTAKGVCWSTSANPTTADDYTTNGSETGVFISNITGLNSGTTYYYRAYATNSIGTGYGDELSFATTLEGSGTEADPYQISNLDELRFLSEHSDYWCSHFIQTADIDATDTQNWNSGAGFSPIGDDSDNPFRGPYDGAGFIIDGLFINRPSSSGVGLFGYNVDYIINLGVTNVNITGNDVAGGLVGLNYGYVANCYSTGSVSGHWYVGGLVGFNNNAPIINCYSAVSVNGTGWRVGGLAGCNSGNYYIENSYSTGSVSGDANVGGLVGYNNDEADIYYCYSTGSVSGNANIGGLVGYNESYVLNSFWNTETSGQSTSAMGTGKTTAEMQNVRTFTDAGWSAGLSIPWDFIGNPYGDNANDDIWNMDGLRINEGYPYLSWQGIQEPPAAPTNIIISINDSNVELFWDAVSGATSYKVYSSDDPYSGFEEDTSGTFVGESWSAPATNEKKFYYVKAVN